MLTARLRSRQPGSLRQLGPALAFYAVFLGVPLVILLGLSMATQVRFQQVPDLNPASYLEALTSRLYQTVLIRTVVLGFLIASVVVPVAYVLAYVMRFVFDRGGRLLLDVVLISLFSGYLVRIYAWRTILGKEGILNTALVQLGLIREPITILIYSNWAVFITLVGLLIPLALLPIYSSMLNVSRDHVDVARDLGAGSLRLHRTILLPMVLPGVSTAFALAFVLAAGDFVVPAMVGGTQAGVMVGNLIADQFRGTGSNWPLGAALAFVILGLLIMVYLLTARLLRAVTRW